MVLREALDKSLLTVKEKTMDVGDREPTAPEVVVHRIGGGDAGNLALKNREVLLLPPGISLLLGGTAAEAAEQMRQAFPDANKFAQIHAQTEMVGSTTVASLRTVGFDVIPDPSTKFPNHARLIHPEGVEGFTEENRTKLSRVFENAPTPRN